MSEQSASDTEHCDRCEEEREETTVLYRDGHIWATVCISCHDDLAAEIGESDEETERTPQDAWETHNESFNYEPPEKPGDAWSSEEYQELYDRVISRRTEWFCDKCSGHGPMRSLQKARRHVENRHGTDLVKQYETPRDELEAATDGGTSESRVPKKSEENHGLTDFVSGEESGTGRQVGADGKQGAEEVSEK
jgi:hypothetical protein